MFFDTYSPRVWTYVARLIGADRHAVADVVQEVFIAAAKSITTFDPQRGTVIRWMFGIAHRQAALYWRRQKRAPLLEDFSTPSRAISSDGEEARVLLESLEQAEIVRWMLAQLPEDMSVLLIGRYLDDRSTSQLAEEFNITEDAVRSRLVRVREKFRELFPLGEIQNQ